jgi:hypothetical protein
LCVSWVLNCAGHLWDVVIYCRDGNAEQLYNQFDLELGKIIRMLVDDLVSPLLSIETVPIHIYTKPLWVSRNLKRYNTQLDPRDTGTMHPAY